MNDQNSHDGGIGGNWRSSGYKSIPPRMDKGQRVFGKMGDKENHVATPTLPPQHPGPLFGHQANLSADRRGGGIGSGGFVKSSEGRLSNSYQSYRRNPRQDDKHDTKFYDKRKTYVEKRVGDVKDESRDKGTWRSPSGSVSNLEILTKWLTSTPEEVLLSIRRHKNAWWRQLLNSDNLMGDELIAALQVLGEKICVDIPFLLEEQASVLTDSCSRNFTRKLVNVVSKIPSGLSLSDANKKFAVETTPLMVITNIYDLCCFVMKIVPNTGVDYFKELVMTSIAVSTLHDPCLEMVGKFKALADQMKELTVKEQKKEDTKLRQKWFGFSEQDMAEFDSETPPDHITDIDIIPSIKELRCTFGAFLRPNKTTGAYNNSEHYVDVQFRLMREDFVQPLRKGIQIFLKDSHDYITRRKKMPLGEMRLYTGVSIVGAEQYRDKVLYKLQLPEYNYKRVKWNKSKRLLSGNLIILTTVKNSLQTSNTYFGIVFNRNVPELQKGIVTLTWDRRPPPYSTEAFLMLESEVYLEAYRHTLRTLQHLDLERFPMKRFIVDTSNFVRFPRYLLGNNIRLKMADGSNMVLPYDQLEWPPAEQFGLDDNQLRAFQAAVTREFTIIQGPPGTGKTFLGLKVAETLLMNYSKQLDFYTGPITVVCYTNHALDQFLEGILNYYKREHRPVKIVRIGGRCKSEALEKYTLREVKYQSGVRDRFRTEKAQARDYVRVCERRWSCKMNEVSGLQNLEGVIDFKGLTVWHKIRSEYPQALWDMFQNINWFGADDTSMEAEGFSEKSITGIWFQFSSVGENGALRRENENRFVDTVQQNNALGNASSTNVEDDDADEDYDMDELMETRIQDADEYFFEALTYPKLKTRWRLSYLNATGFGCSTMCCGESCTQLQQSIYQDMEDLKLIKSLDLHDKKCLEILKAHRNTSLDPGFLELERVKYILRNTNTLTLKGAKEMLQRRINEQMKTLEILRRRRKLLAEIFRLYHGQLLDLPNVTELLKDIRDKKEVDYDQLAMDKRWALYFAVVRRARYLISESLSETQKCLAAAHNELRRVEQLEEGYVLQRCEVVGLTTTGAAKYNDLLRMMRSKVVIVEEAAEVFESHIVTCITQSCEQLILIGDHRQLRPSPTVYELAKTYHLDLSLFERMLNNNLHCYPLKTQHRMRPDISDLVIGTIYDELYNHESVKLYPDVEGLTKNVFFVTHTDKETSTEDSLSKSNIHEATFIGALCHHLIRQGYSPDRITILTMYMGQMFLLKKELNNILETESCSKVRTTCVDNFQGEENDIILLSLVRSNSEGKIGFLGIENRVCVALSRARHGLYVIGNMDMMEKNKTWGHIKQKLEAKDFIGKALELECQIHGTRSKVQYAQDFLKVSPRGGCNKICDTVLPCSHKCKSVCHILDRDHKKYECREPCLKQCGNQMHPCKFLCYQDCRRCNAPVERILNCELQHKKILPCYINVEQYRCIEIVEKTLSCGHTEVLACHIQDYKCNVQVTRKLPCGHQKELKCHVDPLTVKCGTFVSKTLSCGHVEMAECWKSVEDIRCTSLVSKLIENCQHEGQVKCSEKDKPAICQRQCSTRLDCGHQCVMTCHVDDDPDHLLYQCKKDCCRNCVEDHRCKANHPCHQDCPPCTELILRTLPCQHQANLKCFIDIKQYECLDKCQRLLLACGHVCQNKCSQPCGPCHTKVQKLASCQHLLTVACSEDALKENCEQFVQPKSIPECGHVDVKVPCKYAEASPRELVKYCQQPCGHVFSPTGETGCNHTCMGTCKSCFQGRIHVKCQSECGKKLVCGHRCEAPCSAICPPCQKPCLMKCAHTKCEKKCGEPCTKCKEKCSWVCPHAECTRLCGELCNRDPCNEPCPEKLACGHDCLGFCGEPCPPLCRQCNSEELTEFNDLGKDARFVYLDCGHSIEANELEKLMMNDNDNGENGHVPVKLKICPRCEAPIRDCHRFGNLIRQAYQDVVGVKQRFTGNKKSNAMRDQWIFLLKQSPASSIMQVFPLVYVRLRNILYVEVPKKNGKTSSVFPNKINEISMRSLDFIANSAMKAADELLDLQRKEKLVSPKRDKVIDTYCRTLLFMLDRTPLSSQEVKDFNQELDRAHSYQELKLRHLTQSCNRKKAISVYLNAQEFVCSPLPFTPGRRDQFMNVLKELDDVLESDLGITVREGQEISLAIGMNQGHWFKCRDGHIYTSGECGEALEGNRCPECNPPIGTANPQKKYDNGIAMEMNRAATTARPRVFRHGNRSRGSKSAKKFK